MMNRFRKNKKTKEVKETLAELENGHSSSPFSLKLSKKKDTPEEELKLDFADALPSSDDFRTSLLMPKLSARFSMLREQDDPASLMGKASDDSVLFPKRASRLNLFGHNPAMLADIDEVSSNDGSRPSIALGRTDSYVSGDGGYGTDDDRSHNGSIMSRARRAEGNNLFGGRQKVYRIPVRTPGGDSPTAESPRGMGKFVYEHDLNMSAFQRMRLQEKQDKAAAEEAAQEIATPDSEDTPSISSANRTTLSSTASGPAANARSSTAATSIDESQLGTSYLQPSGSTPTSESPSDTRPPSALSINRPGSVRSRRLYGQGLTQNGQSHQNSTLHRLESLSRQRSGTPDLMNRNYTRSATNLRDRLQKLAINEPTVSRPTSPPSSATSPKQLPRLETAPQERLSPTAANFGVPPLSPPSSENDDSNSLLAAALNPEDHGKATAMGLFNRPSTGFDEQQFVRRQLQLHQGRDTPPPLQPSASPRRVISHEQPNRPRGLSKSSFRSRAESASSHYSSDAHGMEHSRASSVEASPRAPGVRTFYAASTNSDSGDEGEDRRSYELSSVTSMGTDYSHHHSFTPKPPTPTGEHLETLPEVRYSDLGDLKPITEDEIPEESQPVDPAQLAPERPDSPTLQPAGMGLDGIRSHLRTGSDRSSIFPPPSPRLPIAVVEHKKLEPEVSVLEVQPSPTTEDHLRVDAIRDSSEAETSSYRDSSRQSAEVPPSRGSQDSSNSAHSSTDVPSWQQDLAYHHRREGSTETQKEREEFAMEIAERRRKIQEKLRSVAESESRSSSPTPSQSGSEANYKYGNGFSLLKHKHSKNGNKADLYGFNSSSTPSLFPEDQSREDRPALFSRHSNSSAPQISSERSFRSRMPTLSRSASRESSRSRGTSPQPGYRMQRDRSSSDASGRSKSRTRYRERDDLETVEEGAVIAHENFVIPDNFEPPAISSVPGSARPSIDGIECLPYDRSASAASGRYRSASRSGTPSFQYERPFQFNQAPNPASIIGASPRPSPATPAYSANATPPLNEIPPSPSANPASVAGGAQAPPPRASGPNSLQKRPINKKLISEPTFVSCTSNVPTVGIPAGTTPPLPPMNPRRRRGTQTILSAFRPESRVSSPAPSITDEHSVFPDDEKRPRSRSRLRKKSLEAGERVASPAPAVPQYPPPSVPVDGGMF